MLYNTVSQNYLPVKVRHKEKCPLYPFFVFFFSWCLWQKSLSWFNQTDFLKLNSEFTILIQIAGRGGGKEKSIALPLKLPKFWVLVWLVGWKRLWTHIRFSSLWHLSAKCSPGTVDCLPAGVSGMVGQILSLLALQGDLGKMCISGLFVLRGWGGSYKLWSFPPSKARCLDCKTLQMPWHLAEALGLHMFSWLLATVAVVGLCR